MKYFAIFYYNDSLILYIYFPPEIICKVSDVLDSCQLNKNVPESTLDTNFHMLYCTKVGIMGDSSIVDKNAYGGSGKSAQTDQK